jgi:hypothetical protein
MQRLRHLVVFFLLAWLPVQAVALPALAARCEAEHGAAAHALGASTAGARQHSHLGGHSSHFDAMSADGLASPAHDPGGDGGSAGSHFCCHHFSAVPVTDLALAADAGPVQATRPVVALFSYFPELQRRPPRA